MAITSVADLLAAYHYTTGFYKTSANFDVGSGKLSTWLRGNSPPSPGAQTPGLDGANCDNTTPGCLEFRNPQSGNSYLAGANISAADNACIMVMDRIWHNSGITATTTTEQAIATAAFPARDRNGSTAGEDYMVWMEINSTTGAGGAVTNTTLNYTNSDGEDTRTATLSHHAGSAGLLVHYTTPFVLQDGDTGVQSIQGITLGTTYSSGTINLVVARLLALIPVASNSTSGFNAAVASAVRLGMPRLYDGTCLYFVQCANTSGGYDFSGHLTIAQG